SRVRDTSWIHPGRAAWSWLDDHASPGHADAQRAAIDAAAQAGWEYVTVDAGWHAEDVPGLVAYAADRGVRLILWFDVAGISPAVLDRVAGWGVAGVKVDYFYNDRRLRIRQMDDVARWAAARRLVIDFHGCTIPRGLQRTWPNVLSLEAVRGEEHAPLAARDVVNLAFTRNAVGSMDFTPRGDPAQAIVFESGLQHYAHGGPLLDEIPADWDDTRLLSGAPDDHVVIARRDGTRWFVGGLFARPRRLAVRLPRGRYRARFADGTQRDVSGTLTVAGDFAAILTPYDAAHGT
ncbi:MAG: alpha-glucosidase, partial [Solirubrobacteraceae bacterium]|nr:alpha-glucosidase [Solirubrobacteraceae bacterium]